MTISILMKAKHDRNGNPRSVYVVLGRDGEILDAIDRGYGTGTRVLKEKYPDAVTGPEFNVTNLEYRWLIKHHSETKEGI